MSLEDSKKKEETLANKFRPSKTFVQYVEAHFALDVLYAIATCMHEVDSIWLLSLSLRKVSAQIRFKVPPPSLQV